MASNTKNYHGSNQNYSTIYHEEIFSLHLVELYIIK
jgi:hypothetical protein